MDSVVEAAVAEADAEVADVAEAEAGRGWLEELLEGWFVELARGLPQLLAMLLLAAVDGHVEAKAVVARAADIVSFLSSFLFHL